MIVLKNKQSIKCINSIDVRPDASVTDLSIYLFVTTLISKFVWACDIFSIVHSPYVLLLLTGNDNSVRF